MTTLADQPVWGPRLAAVVATFRARMTASIRSSAICDGEADQSLAGDGRSAGRSGRA